MSKCANNEFKQMNCYPIDDMHRPVGNPAAESLIKIVRRVFHSADGGLCWLRVTDHGCEIFFRNYGHPDSMAKELMTVAIAITDDMGIKNWFRHKTKIGSIVVNQTRYHMITVEK